jgi:KUP system potassium uptake protein
MRAMTVDPGAEKSEDQEKLEPLAPEEKKEVSAGNLLKLSLLSLGVVFGDIATNPLFTVRSCFQGRYGIQPSEANVFGVISLIFWSLILVVSIKYLFYIMYADNRGEGGVLALMTLLHNAEEISGGRRKLLLGIGLFGAALLYGDGTITPAISVLSAIEGLEVATDFFTPYVVPITIVILILLFLFQRQGPKVIGTFFGPIMVVWFGTIAVLGIFSITKNPEILQAVNPRHAVSFFFFSGWPGFLVLGIVFLAVAGGEALYADLGHFGLPPIRLAWFCLVLPSLLLNYFGQGALLLKGGHVTNPFYQLAPSWTLYPVIVIATLATSIASQAIISGAFSITRQAIMLGYCPRMKIAHTSEEEVRQVYIGTVNWTIMIITIGLVLGFKKSTHLAAAYGIAVAMAMLIDTLLTGMVARGVWQWPMATSFGVTLFFFIPDATFATANLAKVISGGWVPLLLACLVFGLLTTWRRGRELLSALLFERRVPLETYLEDYKKVPPQRVSGMAIFLSSSIEGVPPAMIYQLKHNKVLHEKVIFLTVVTDNIPWVWRVGQLEIKEINETMYRVIAHQGYMEKINVAQIMLRLGNSKRPKVKDDDISFFIGRENILPVKEIRMSAWRGSIFAFMMRNSLPVTEFFEIPPDRIIELGVFVEF